MGLRADLKKSTGAEIREKIDEIRPDLPERANDPTAMSFNTGEIPLVIVDRIEVLTEGLLVRRIQRDPELKGVGLVILDEFHERNLQTDLALALCLDVAEGLRDDLRLLVMSASLDVAPLLELLPATEVSAAELAGVYGRLGALYGAHRMYAGAELALRNARSLDPQGFEWAYYAAHLALEQGEPEQALGYLGEAAQIDPTYPTLPLRRGEALLGLNRLQEARAAYEQVVAIPDLRAAALYGLAQIDLLERDWAAAAEKLRETLALQPSADAAHYLGLLGTEKAASRLGELLQDPDAEVREIASESLADLDRD